MFDPADPRFLADPYPAFAALRAEGEVHRHEGLGMAVAVSHRAAAAVLRHRGLGRIWTDATPAERFASFNLLHRNSLLENEPPVHTRLRGLIGSAFARGHVRRLHDRIGALTGELARTLADRIATDGEADLLTHLAQPLPVTVIADLLGVPATEREPLVPWSNAIVKMYEYGAAEPVRDDAERAAGEFAGYLRGLAAERAARPGEDLLSHLVAAGLSGDEVVATAVLVLMAGHEATVNALGNGTHALLHRGQWAELAARLPGEPGLAESTAEELLRYDSPLQLFERTATEPVEIAGHRLVPGEKIGALLGAAARDPAVFADPDRLDPARTPNRHLGFGAGIHYCVGAPLARLELAAALRALATALPDLRLGSPAVRRPEFVIRGWQRLPVTR